MQLDVQLAAIDVDDKVKVDITICVSKGIKMTNHICIQYMT